MDWRYYGFDPDMGFEFRHFQDDMYESVVVKFKNAAKADRQVIFHVFPELQEFHTRDVWKKHPKKEGVWLFAGRTDDFVKLGTLTKFNASHVENAVLSDSKVAAEVVGGDGMPVPFLIVELVEDVDEKTALDAISPLIDEINCKISRDIRLEKEMILFVGNEKPLVKMGIKQTVNRRDTVARFRDDTDELYRRRVARKLKN
jgi:hypothetical protein